MALKSRFLLIILSINYSLCANNYTLVQTSTYNTEVHSERDVASLFIEKNDSLSFKYFINASDLDNSFCHYESEYFLYSLIMALDFKNNSAILEMDRVIDEFYKRYKIDKGQFVNDFSSYIRSDRNFFGYDTLCERFEDIDFFIKKTFVNKKRNKVKSLFLQSIIEKGDSLCYQSLSDTLRQKCMERLSSDDYFIYNFKTAKMLLYSIYHIDKNGSPDGYYFLYNTISNFYLEKEIIPREKSARLMIYLLEKAAKMNLPAAIKEYNHLMQNHRLSSSERN